MQIINHAMTGAIIGLSVSAPVAIPLAFVSHFAVDALPHAGNIDLSRKKFNIVLVSDIALCLVLVAIILIRRPSDWWLAILCAFLATSPDLMWFKGYRDQGKGKTPRTTATRHPIVKLHEKVQWFQQPIGIVIEVIWAAITGGCLYFLLRP